MVREMIRFGLVAVALVLVGCGSDAPSSEPSEQPGGSAGTSSQASTDRDAGDVGSGGQAQTETDAGQSDATECRFNGNYDMVAVLTSGPSSCANSAEYLNQTILRKDETECTANVCIGGGTTCIKFECERGNPVSDCSATVSNGSGCTYEWALSRAE